MNSAHKKYKSTQITSASRETILLMLYEGAIRFTKKALEACQNKDIAERGHNIGRVYDIVMELNNTLDHKIGGDVAVQLEQLYMFIMDELTKANIGGKAEHLNNVLKILETLYDGWLKAVETLKQNGGLPSVLNQKS